MIIPIIILIAALLVLVVMYVLDDALHVMNERAGLLPGKGMVWSKRIVWALLLLVVAQFFIPADLFEPPPPRKLCTTPTAFGPVRIQRGLRTWIKSRVN